jgi:hypothetical protein
MIVANLPDVDYTVVLVVPGFGEERENAEAVVESALDWLNANKEEPGFRFAPRVSAHLEVARDADEVRERIESDDNLATVFLHDLGEAERDDLLRLCEGRDIGACITVDAPRPAGSGKEPLKVVIRSEPRKGPPAHTLCAETLTASVGEDEEM